MRGALARFAIAVAAMVALAFLIPLALTVREFAKDRAFVEAERQAASVEPVLVVTTDQVAVTRALASTPVGAAGRIAVHLPSGAVIGPAHADDEQLGAAVRQGRAFTARVAGGYAVLQPVVLDQGAVAVVEVYLLDDDLQRGLGTVWLVLGGVAVVLITLSSLVADRLAARLVGATRHLAGGARALGAGDLDVRVDAQGPYELREVGLAFNAMAGRMVQMITAEREFAADLSHRLRTPLTALRLNAAALDAGPVADQTRQVVAWLEQEVDLVITTARAGSARREAAECDATDVLAERMAFWSALAEDQGRRWGFSGPTGPVPVPVAQAELAAAVDAALGNVFRHTGEGTEFSVTLLAEGGAAVILVADAGPGIAAPEVALRRGQGSRREGSTGLGLDIVRRMAEGAGGDVRIERSPLGGAQVRIRLPVAPGAERPPGVSGPGPRTAGRRAGRRAVPGRRGEHTAV
ncbi:MULTISPECIES: HAMP domain-containing sensor histidine kinase [unclassified Kitasatospora]|uniref:sensor histidine kinase n=1 Tax=unclassified Kitasatospora TaxID=2633591 RepID=UPI0033C6C9C5